MTTTQEPAIRVNSLSKIYRLYDSPMDRFKEALHPKRKKYHRDFYALKNVSFEVNKGETIGIIGQNGSGKSTLLKILAGVLTPSSGTVSVNGKISSLLELGMGFNPELTGIENVYFNGTLLGFTKEEIDEKLDDILAFADIGDFVHQPVKTYSSGMYVRLAFAVAIQVEPDILIVDEALSVGDAIFQVRSMNKMLSFVASGKTIFFVSHDTTAIKTLCNTSILLDSGQILKQSEASSVVDYYNNMVLNNLHCGEEDLLAPAEDNSINSSRQSNWFFDDENPPILGLNSINTGTVELLSIHVLNSKNQKVETVTSEDDIKIIWKIRALKEIKEPHYGFIIKNRLGVSAFETNTYCMKTETKLLKKDQEVAIEIRININLAPDIYSVSLGVAYGGYDKGSFKEYLLLARDVFIIKVIENLNSILYSGYYNMKPHLIIHYK